MENLSNEFNLEEELREVKERREKQEAERRAQREKELENKTLLGKIKNAWIDTREEEKKNNFSKRHNRLEKAANEYYKDDTTFLRTKHGVVHIFGEGLYQIDKLKPRKKDNTIRYVIRNRIPAGILAFTMIFSTAKAVEKARDNILTEQPVQVEVIDNDITLTRIYTIKFGDTLSELSDETGIKTSKIASDNNISNANMIGMNQRIKLEYSIDPSDLEYYTETIDVDDRSLGEIAGLYETDGRTLVTLNTEAIEIDQDGYYVISSDTLLVPNFISQSELASLKATKK